MKTDDAIVWKCRICGLLNAECWAWTEKYLECNDCGDKIYLKR